MITGYAYFPGGSRVPNAPIEVWGPEDTKLDETLTNAAGEFSYLTTSPFEHTFILNLGDGHRAYYTIRAEELSGTQSLPENNELSSPKFSFSPSTQELEQLIETAVNKQIRPLREQLEAYEEKIRFHDLIGGIGYIFGLMGLWFYFGTRRQS
jgi:nickel transport protein